MDENENGVTDGGTQQPAADPSQGQEQNTGGRSGVVEPGSEGYGGRNRGNPIFGKMRHENRQLRAELEQIKQMLGERGGQGGKPEKVDFYTDPDSALERYAQKIKDDLLAELNKGKQAEREQQTLGQKRKSALNFLNLQADFKSNAQGVEDALDEIIERDERLSTLFQSDPDIAVELAYARYAGGGRKVDPVKKAQAMGVKGSGSMVRGNLQRDEAVQLTKTLSDEEFLKRLPEIKRTLKQKAG